MGKQTYDFSFLENYAQYSGTKATNSDECWHFF